MALCSAFGWIFVFGLLAGGAQKLFTFSKETLVEHESSFRRNNNSDLFALQNIIKESEEAFQSSSRS